MAVFGLDFGTTNSLAAYVEDDEAVPLLDDERPHPSVLWYHGAEPVVGRDAKTRLSELRLGVVGDVVRSPKRYLGTGESIYVAGRTFKATEVVGHFLKYLRNDACSRGLAGHNFDRAILTIPVHLAGQGRQELRDAAGEAGIRVDQFVHEPLAALYGYIRSQGNFRRQLAELRDQVVLVFDWGGGTLDLTLCRFDRGAIVQVQNLGNDLVGGDRFDERIVNFVKEKHVRAHGLVSWPGESEGARARLFEECEVAKIDLSQRTKHTIYVRNCLRVDGPASDLRVEITREDLIALTHDLVQDGVATIDRLLGSAGQKDATIAFCLSTGGMLSMPYVREQLQQRFGLSRVRFAEHGDRIIAQGAAWIGHDRRRLCLAKPFEILDADNTYIPLIHAGEALPGETETKRVPAHFYCVDPRDGIAKLQFARPKQPSRMQPADPRQVYVTLTLQVDPEAKPLVERLAVILEIEENLVVRVVAESTICRDKVEATIHDLEFGLWLDGLGQEGERERKKRDAGEKRVRFGARPVARPATIALRSNVTRQKNRWDLVPGEMLEWGRRVTTRFTDRQREEHVYYVPCAECKRLIYEIRRDGCVECCVPVRAVRGDAVGGGLTSESASPG